MDVETLNCGNSLKNNGNNILRSCGIQLNNSWRGITGITGLVVIAAVRNNMSCGVFAVSNNSDSVGGIVQTLSIQGDYSDNSKRVGLDYVGGQLKATKVNEGMYQNYVVSFFGFHP